MTDGDGDGVPDIVELQQGTDPTNSGSYLDTDGDNTPNYTDLDDDGDGSLDNIEQSAPNGGDFNNDGVLDILQKNVATVINPITSGYASLDTTASICGSNAFSIVTEGTLPVQDNSGIYPVGLADFELECTNTGSTAPIKIYYNKLYDTSQWIYKKYNSVTNTYTDISAIVTYTIENVGGINVTVANYSITDGGVNDEDGIANRVIVDPSGPSINPSSIGGGRTYSCRDENALNYRTYGFSKPELCEYEIVLVTPEEENVIQESEDAQEVEQEVPIKGDDYLIKNDFDSCLIITNIQNPDYNYSGERYSDTALSSYEGEIDKFSQIGIINGYDDGSFGPNNEMTRTEFLKIALISHCYEYRNQDSSSLAYIDIDAQSWQAKVIKKAQDLGMINGDIDENGNKVFRPNDVISKAEAVKILMKLSLISPNNPVNLGYEDITTSWHEKYIITGETLGLFNASDDNKRFHPDSGVKREEMIDLVSKLVKLYK